MYVRTWYHIVSSTSPSNMTLHMYLYHVYVCRWALCVEITQCTPWPLLVYTVCKSSPKHTHRDRHKLVHLPSSSVVLCLSPSISSSSVDIPSGSGGPTPRFSLRLRCRPALSAILLLLASSFSSPTSWPKESNSATWLGILWPTYGRYRANTQTSRKRNQACCRINSTGERFVVSSISERNWGDILVQKITAFRSWMEKWIVQLHTWKIVRDERHDRERWKKPQLDDEGRRKSKLEVTHDTCDFLCFNCLLGLGQWGCPGCMAYSPHHQSYCTPPSGPEHRAASASQAALPYSSTLQSLFLPGNQSQETVRDRRGEGRWDEKASSCNT